MKELSYYQLLLTEYLIENFPELLDDQEFIVSRADEAAELFSKLIKEGVHQDVASGEANTLLFEGLTGFSKFCFIKDAIRENFEKVPEDKVAPLALLLLNEADDVFNSYDDLEAEADRIGERKMYWEIIGLIDIYIKENGLQ